MGLNGQNNLAQGDALGKRATQQLALSGLKHSGRSPGLYYLALSGRKYPISTAHEAPISHSSWAVPIRSAASYGVKLC
jgi:hypothetical protein